MLKSKGNMYKWVTHTWNPLAGRCSHECEYCYMNSLRRFNKKYKGEPRIYDKAINEDLGEDNFIFVCSATDLFARDVPEDMIKTILTKCKSNNYNKYLFQTKEPVMFRKYKNWLPEDCILVTTIETNRSKLTDEISNAPIPEVRYYDIKELSNDGLDVMVTIEPIMDFDLDILVSWMKDIEPIQINIGADSGNNNLKEPNSSKVESLCQRLKPFTNLKLKDNLGRIVDTDMASSRNGDEND